MILRRSTNIFGYIRTILLAGVWFAVCSVAWTAGSFSAGAADWASVVMYHRFGESDFPSTNIRLHQFDEHLRELKSNNYTVLPLSEIVSRFESGEQLPDRTVAITIDDAYLSVYREAWPRLKAAGLPFTLFVATDVVDRGLPGYMNWQQIRELANDGVTIGSQTVTHPHMPRLTLEKSREELVKSNGRFLSELGFTPQLFAYPYGEFGLDLKGLVAEIGFRAAFGQHSGAAYGNQDRFALPRWAMNESYGDIKRFKLAVNALPFRVKDITPPDNILNRNPPAFGFTVAEDLPGLKTMNCYSSHHGGPLRLERLGDKRIEVRLQGPFPAGRGRINCTMLGPEQRWRWLGTQFYIPRR